MNAKRTRSSAATSELLVLPDGRVLAHNLTPALAALLAEFDPGDDSMQARARKTLARQSGNGERSAVSSSGRLP